METEPTAGDLLEFIAASPSPYHAVATASTRLTAAGFTPLDETSPWPPAPGSHFVARGGTLVAWATADHHRPASPFHIIGAHTDSPNLRIKPRPDTGRAGYRQLGVEVYGGALWNSWLDRDLGYSGRVATRAPDGGVATHLVRDDRPLMRIPQLAIHLDRDVNGAGLKLNPQSHLAPVWGLGRPSECSFRDALADRLDLPADQILAWDVMLHDLTPPTVLGIDGSMLAAPRIDNLLSCHAALSALLKATDHPEPAGSIPVVCLFDHEEIGSQSSAGADSSILATLLERVTDSLGGSRLDFHRALAGSLCVSADGAHATHPNYVDRHEPDHQIELDGGPVLKLNANVRYATDASSGAALQLAAERAGVRLQQFVVRTDLGCGSTIGPVTAARLGIATVDVGVAQLSMHSARELCGSHDPARFVALLTEALRGTSA